MRSSGALAGRTILMSGGSRGIGLAIAKRAAADGASIVLLAKTGEPHPKLTGTVFTAAEEIRAAGGSALPLVGDVRSDDDLVGAVEQAVAEFGGIDIVVNNASAIDLSSTLDLAPKRYDLMHQINQRGTFMLTRAALPALVESADARILSLSPPLNLSRRWLAAYPAYMTAKYGMTLATLGIGAEFAERGVSACTLWPRTTIQTAAVANVIGGDELMGRSRTPDVYADAAHLVLTAPAGRYAGESLLCEDVLAEAGITDLSAYSPGVAEEDLFPDAFVD